MKKIVFLTGAGISKESDIPTFRDAGDGLWENCNVQEVATHSAIVKNPGLVYKFINELKNKYKDCVPNEAHKIIAELEKNYEVVVITQNIDTLHEQAGSSNVLHLHGNLTKVRATDNEDLLFDYVEDISPETRIEGHLVRPHIVLFGEPVPNIIKASEILKEADICVVVGTSFNVYPAANLVMYVPYGNPIYYIDPNPAYTPYYPDIKVIKEVATTGMKELFKILKNDQVAYIDENNSEQEVEIS
ncbi:SIR2 family NAD-dependent protein deacylase [Intestinibacter sp.]|uniref:SIR2 family NAD-dependent protein deacylase n=1 Tax=Intestinibacter sp. TaxID=1965304 RepID=UPI003F177C20